MKLTTLNVVSPVASISLLIGSDVHHFVFTVYIMIALIIMPFIDRINVRYKLLGTYYERSGQKFMIIFLSYGCLHCKN